jgi:hypothetical protein
MALAHRQHSGRPAIASGKLRSWSFTGADRQRGLKGGRVLAAGSRPDARLFTGPRGGRVTTAVLRDATHWDEVASKLGYEHLRRHDLRHTGLTWMADTFPRLWSPVGPQTPDGPSHRNSCR